MTTPDLRSPFVERVISLLPRGHEEAMKQAFYNVAAICLFFMMAGAAMAVYFILEPFVKPLLWAILVGSVLHPLKQKSAVVTSNWLSQLKECNTLLIFGFLSVPLQAVNKGAEWMGTALLCHLKLIVSLTIGFPIVHILKQHCTFSDVIYMYETIVNSSIYFSLSIDTALYPVTLSVILGLIGIFITVISHHRLDISVYLLWILACVTILIFLGSWSVIVIAPLLILTMVGLAIDWGWLLCDFSENSSDSDRPLAKNDDVAVNVSTPKFSNGLTRLMKNHIIASALSTLATPAVTTEHNKLLESSSSNRYILRAFWACMAVQLWRHMWLFHFVPIPLIYYFFKVWGSYFNLWKFLDLQKSKVIESTIQSFSEHKDKVFPKPLQMVYKVKSVKLI